MAVTLPAAGFNADFEEGSASAIVKSGNVKESRGTATLLMVPPDQIQIADGFNVRILGTEDYEAGIAALADSIESEGFYRHKPITGVVTKMEDGSQAIVVTDGHRRMAAIDLLRESGRPVPEMIPVILEPAGTSMIERTVALAKTGTELTPLELATVCKRLQGYGVEDKEICKRLSITPRYLSNLYLLLTASRKVLGMVANKKVAATVVIEELRANGKAAATGNLEAAVNAAEKAGKSKATRKDVEAASAAAPDAGTAPAASAWKTEKFVFKAARGDSVDPDTIKMFRAVLGGCWWDTTGDASVIEITEDIKIAIAVKHRPAPTNAAPPAADEESDEDL